MTDNETILRHVDSLMPDLVPLVKVIEGKTETTRGHYGEYMSMISRLSNDNRTMAQIVALAAIKAGANKQGVKDALNICYPGSI